LFRSRCEFERLAPRLRELAQVHDLRGFRAPSTLRRADWIPLLGFDFDSSFSDTDVFEPQPGGTCSIFPFFLGATVELPYTMPQDHTLVQLLRRDPLPIWLEKATWLAARGGMILTLTHPDYCGTGPTLSAYRQLLVYLSSIVGAWRALPSEVAEWWRHRAALTLRTGIDGVPIILGSSRAVAISTSSEQVATWGLRE
jgi:hypothetical protein